MIIKTARISKKEQSEVAAVDTLIYHLALNTTSVGQTIDDEFSERRESISTASHELGQESGVAPGNV